MGTLPSCSAWERASPQAKGLKRMKGERHGQLNEGEMLETARQTLLEKAVLHAGFVHNKLGCSHAVKVNACPPHKSFLLPMRSFA